MSDAPDRTPEPTTPQPATPHAEAIAGIAAAIRAEAQQEKISAEAALDALRQVLDDDRHALRNAADTVQAIEFLIREHGGEPYGQLKSLQEAVEKLKREARRAADLRVLLRGLLDPEGAAR